VTRNDDYDDDNNDNNNSILYFNVLTQQLPEPITESAQDNNNSIQSFICVLHQQLKGQLQTQQTQHKNIFKKLEPQLIQ
jgi:hypothetical protein